MSEQDINDEISIDHSDQSEQSHQISQTPQSRRRHYHIVLDVDGEIAVERIQSGKFRGDWRTIQSAEAPLVFRIVQDARKKPERRLIYVQYNDEYHPELNKIPWIHIETLPLIFRGITPRQWITQNYDIIVESMYHGIIRNTEYPKSFVKDNEKKIADRMAIEQLEREYQKAMEEVRKLQKLQEELLIKKAELAQARLAKTKENKQ